MSSRLTRILIVLAGVMGADGVMLAAVALAERAIIHPGIGILAASGFFVATALFAGDLTLRHYAGHGLFPFAAPTGGALLIASWLALAVAAAWPRRIENP